MSAITKATVGFDSRLCELGFIRASNYRWVKDFDTDIKFLFAINPLKGVTYAPSWGFNVNFIPKLCNLGRLKWGRTAKTAKYDLCIDPIDETGTVPADISYVYLSGVQEVTDELVKQKGQLAIDRALSDYQKVNGLDDLYRLFKEREGLTYRRFSFYMYIQHNIANPYLMFASGQHEDAEEALAKVIQEYGIDPNDKILKESLEIARNYFD